MKVSELQTCNLHIQFSPVASRFSVSELSYCLDNPDTCANDGKCVSLSREDGSYRCQCRQGYLGKNCEILDEFLLTSVAPPRITPPPPDDSSSPMELATKLPTLGLGETTAEPTTAARTTAMGEGLGLVAEPAATRVASHNATNEALSGIAAADEATTTSRATPSTTSLPRTQAEANATSGSPSPAPAPAGPQLSAHEQLTEATTTTAAPVKAVAGAEEDEDEEDEDEDEDEDEEEDDEEDGDDYDDEDDDNDQIIPNII